MTKQYPVVIRNKGCFAFYFRNKQKTRFNASASNLQKYIVQRICYKQTGKGCSLF